MAEILLYGYIDSYSSADIIQKMNEAEGDDLAVRVNCMGGEPEYGWGIAAKFKEFKGAKSVIIDGQAHSMAMFFLCYAENVTAYDVSEFLVHRAAYPSWYEQSPEYFTDSVKQNLIRVNKSLQNALASKINVDAFENLKQVQEKGIKFKDIFSLENRYDIFLTAADAKKIGLIDKVEKLTPQKSAEINSFYRKAAMSGFKENNPKTSNMTIETLKAENPAIFNEVVKLGATQERERIEAIMVFNEIDPEKVKTAIASGNPLSAKDINELTIKVASKARLGLIKKDAAGNIITEELNEDEKNKTPEKVALSTFEKETRAKLGLDKK